MGSYIQRGSAPPPPPASPIPIQLADLYQEGGGAPVRGGGGNGTYQRPCIIRETMHSALNLLIWAPLMPATKWKCSQQSLLSAGGRHRYCARVHHTASPNIRYLELSFKFLFPCLGKNNQIFILIWRDFSLIWLGVTILII